MAKSDLSQVLKGSISDDAKVLEAYSYDASLFKVVPKLVIAPKDSEDIRNLVKFAAANKGYSLTARSGGTDMTGGPLNESIILDMQKNFNHILEVGDGYAVTQPGVFYRDFEKETLAKGLLLPSYPASREICTVGGMVANNSSGEKSLVYGDTGDYLMEVKVVLKDGEEYVFKALNREELDYKMQQQDFEGEIYRGVHSIIENNYELIKNAKPKVSKNSAGYLLWDVWDRDKGTFDLTKLFAGSQGTLGIATEIKFKLIKPKAHSRLVVVFMKDLSSLAQVVTTTLQYKPESFESYDDNTLKLAVRFLPGLLKVIGAKNMFSLFWQFLPEFKMVITGGVPKLVLLAEFAGDSEQEVIERAGGAETSLKKLDLQVRVAKNEQEAKKYWTMRRESFNLLRHHGNQERTAPFIDDLIVRPEQLPDFLPKLNEILSHYKIKYTVAGHVGDANFHIIPLMNLQDKNVATIIPELAKKVYELVFSFHGSMTGEHNDGLMRTPYLKEMYGSEIYNLFEKIKLLFDPQNIFNPRKKVGGSLEYAMQHLIK